MADDGTEGERGPLTRTSMGAYYTTSGEGKSGKKVKEPRVDRAFVIVRHKEYGYLILKAFKNRKGLHGQLPGGKVDSTDASPAAGVARELFEECGIDIRDNLDRLKLASFPNGKVALGKRQYFRLVITDQDRVGDRKPDSGQDFELLLSNEHVGYVFEQDALKASEWLALHSGGKSQIAMLNLETNNY